MKNVWLIFKDDVRNLMRNVICAIVTMGLIIVPPMYAWLTSLGFWDPYNNTGGITVAVANEDEGYKDDLITTRLDVGASIVNKLHANKQFNWIFESEDEAVDGVKSGDYYAAIVIPKDFSSNLMSVLDGKDSKAQIEYYSNEKTNAIAPHVTSQGATELQSQIDEAINKTISDVVLGVDGAFTGFVSSDGVASYAQQLINQLNGVIEELNQAHAELEAFGALTTSVSKLESGTSQLLDKIVTETDRVADAIDALKDAITSNTNYERYTTAYALLPENLQSQFPAPQELTQGIDMDAQELEGYLQDFKTATEKMAVTSLTLSRELGSVATSLDNTAQALGTAANDLTASRDTLQNVLDSKDASEIHKLIGNDPEAIASFLSAPTKLVTHSVYKVDNNGSSMSPFYTSLSLWIGAIFLVALTSVNLSDKRRAKLKHPTAAETYLGRYGIFALIAIAQALVVCIGNVFFIGVQCNDFWLYALAGIVVALVFSMLAYTLTASFGVIGKAIMVIILVLQVGGAGGIFPIELSAPFFQDVYPWLPLTHSMNAFESAMFGMYGNQYWMSLGCLGLYFAAMLVLGLVLRNPIIRLNDFVMKKLDETKVL